MCFTRTACATALSRGDGPLAARYTILIPTRDSARWVGQFLDAYRALGIEPFYVLDARSDIETKKILQGKRANVVEMTPDGDYVEAGMIEFGSRCAGTEWILRFDDDEFPLAALLQWVETIGINSINHGWCLSRRELFKVSVNKQDIIYYNRCRSLYHTPDRPSMFNAQLRLYRAKQARYSNHIHTPGLEVEFCGYAPNEFYFAHCDALVRNIGERIEKIRRYERIQKGSTWRLTNVYLPELFTLRELNAAPLESTEFDSLLSSISRRERVNTDIRVDDAMIAIEINKHELLLDEEFSKRHQEACSASAGDIDFRWAMLLPIWLIRSIAQLMCTSGWRAGGMRLWRHAEARRCLRR